VWLPSANQWLRLYEISQTGFVVRTPDGCGPGKRLRFSFRVSDTLTFTLEARCTGCATRHRRAGSVSTFEFIDPDSGVVPVLQAVLNRP
jgi:hypothetical protein